MDLRPVKMPALIANCVLVLTRTLHYSRRNTTPNTKNTMLATIEVRLNTNQRFVDTWIEKKYVGTQSHFTYVSQLPLKPRGLALEVTWAAFLRTAPSKYEIPNKTNPKIAFLVHFFCGKILLVIAVLLAKGMRYNSYPRLVHAHMNGFKTSLLATQDRNFMLQKSTEKTTWESTPHFRRSNKMVRLRLGQSAVVLPF